MIKIHTLRPPGARMQDYCHEVDNADQLIEQFVASETYNEAYIHDGNCVLLTMHDFDAAETDPLYEDDDHFD